MQEENLKKKETYGTFQGIQSMFSGDYVRESWKSNCDPVDLKADIVTMTCNLALIGALVMTVSIESFLSVNGDDFYGENPLPVIYILLLALCSVFEG
jgi:hypothetical protein